MKFTTKGAVTITLIVAALLSGFLIRTRDQEIENQQKKILLLQQELSDAQGTAHYYEQKYENLKFDISMNK